MALTALGWISASMRKIGVLASGEAPSASEAEDALGAANDLIDNLSNEQLLIPTKIREVFTLVAGQQTYQMGTGAPDFNTARPQKIENALLQYSGINPAIELPMDIYTKDEYANVLLKTLQSPIPMCIYPDYAFPNCNVSLWPVPNVDYNLVLYSWKPLAQLSSLTTTLSLPPGYERFLIYALALDLAPEYGRAVPDIVATAALQSKAVIKRMNSKAQYLTVDNALIGKSSVFDWRTGGFK